MMRIFQFAACLAFVSGCAQADQCSAEKLDGEALWRQYESAHGIVRDMRTAVQQSPTDVQVVSDLERILRGTGTRVSFVRRLSILHAKMSNASDRSEVGKFLVSQGALLNDELDADVLLANTMTGRLRSAGVAAHAMRLVDQMRKLREPVMACKSRV